MKRSNEGKLEAYVINLTIALSLIIGSVGSFWMYTNKYIKSNKEVLDEINRLLSDIHVVQDKLSLVLFLVSTLGVLTLWVIGFVLYKVIFKVAKVNVNDIELLIALGSGYIISFLFGYFFVEQIHPTILTMGLNIIEMLVVLYGLFDKIKTGIVRCTLIRTVILIINVGFSYMF